MKGAPIRHVWRLSGLARLTALTVPMMVLGVSLSCSGSFIVQRGVIEFYNDEPVIRVSDTMIAAEPGTIQVLTYGGGCIRKGFMTVSVEGLTAVLEPFDSVDTGSDVCTLELAFFLHEADVEFKEPGLATIRVLGTSEPSGKLLTVERTVVVQ